MILINNEKHAIVVGGVFILPGSNVVADDFSWNNYPGFGEAIAQGKIEVCDKVSVKAIEKANTQKIVDALAERSPKSSKIKEAAKARKEELDKFDAEVEAKLKKVK